MAITKRDVEIIEWVNLHGFVLAEQVQEFFGLGKTVVYRRLKEMVEQGVLKRERILYDYGNVYWVTKDGVELCESEMAAGKKPSVNNFVHDKKLVDLSVKLLKKYEGSSWITARQIKSRLVRKASEKDKFKALAMRVADGILIVNGKKYAVELELSLKNRTRVKQIIGDYAERIAKGQYVSVIYVVEKESIAKVLREEMNQTVVSDRFQIMTF
ncbi:MULTISPECIES: hypothetical protein [Bacillus cereus group]|uniref:Replication-relaxation family protein n=3 Tax=Bacillus cereus group TaxID=86661 RepID=A0A9W7QKT8_BACCE|nr:hypothetical protein [Bacillus cereus]KAB2400686.1 hypothetical protein F8172_00320 [Bacillus cereus]KAB2405897.1 hypothetical protein F8170_14310 [Bacillus cereus]KAB2431370.1 hypothetical protein F8168_04545 [Bacillus cereus]